MKKLAVIGSVNMDMVVRVDRFPVPGETRRGEGFQIVPGGKGANQAVALGRLGADVVMVGMVGGDSFGAACRNNFMGNGVDVSALDIAEGETTGTAVIEVECTGENHIIIVPGANALCNTCWLQGMLPRIMDRDIFLFQLEIPHRTVFQAMRAVKEAGKTVILDPAPACPLPEEVLGYIDYITPNETELIAITPDVSGDMETRMHALIAKGVGTVIAKCGADGAYVLSAEGFRHARGFRVRPVDSTAAGDTFNAGLACGLADGMDIFDAAVFANAAGAISVTAPGAQTGMPTRDAVEQYMRGN